MPPTNNAPPSQDQVAPTQPQPTPAPPPTPGQQPPVPNTNPVNKPLAPPPKKALKSKPVKAAASKENSTQKTLLISEIRDGMVIMKDGSMRAVVMCQSINFDLMNPQEREGVEQAYQGFLNSLYFPVQVYIRSQRVNLDSYMEKLENVRREQDNILLALLMEDYIAYVRYLIEAANIMDKQFYVVVPYYPSLLTKEGIATGAQKFSELLKPKQSDVVTVNETDFTKYKQELTQQVRVVVNGLNQTGVHAIPLNTQELIELYYNVYNPVTAKSQPLTNAEDLEATLVSKGQAQDQTGQSQPGGGN